MSRRLLGTLLEEAEAEALVVVASGASDPDLAPFVGTAHLGEAFLVAAADGAAHLGYLTPMEDDEAASTGCALLRPRDLDLVALRRESASGAEFWAALLRRALAHLDLRPGHAALAGHYSAGTVQEACGYLEAEGWSFRSGRELLLSYRKSKQAEEVAAIRAAALGTSEAMTDVARMLAAARPAGNRLLLEGEPLTVARLRRAIARRCAEHGLEQPHGNIVSMGRDAAIPHTQGASEVPLTRGTSIVVDLFPKGRLYADCTRTFCVGEAPAELAAAHRQVAAALMQAQRAALSGTTAHDLHNSVCDRFEDAGYATVRGDPNGASGYVHGLGHGVGYELHELPSFRLGAGDAGVLADGDVFTLEPGLYDPEAGWGVRLEDLCHLGPAGLEILTPLPYDLDPRVWPPTGD